MRTIIAGSRTLADIEYVIAAVKESGFGITTVISGGAVGVDKCGENWAHIHNRPVEQYLADWNTLGKRAGYVRNVTMAENADALIAVWNGESKGTKHMIDIAQKKGLKVYVKRISLNENDDSC